MTQTGETTVRRMRPGTIAAIVAIMAGIVASVVVVVMRGGDGSTGIDVTARAGDPHAPRTVSKEVLNAVDKVTRQVPQAELVAEGRALFRSSERALAGESCQSCHTEGGANADLGTTPHGIPGPAGQQALDQSFRGVRDPIALFGAGETDPYMWNGDVATLQEVAVATIENHFKPQFKDNVPAGEVTAQAAALTAYMETIEAPTTNFDRGTMSDAAVRGLRLFQQKAGCVECHGGPNFTDGLNHNTLVPQGPTLPNASGPNNDFGAQQPAPPKEDACPLTLAELNALQPDECAFQSPILRGLSITAPYMHNGFCKVRVNGNPTTVPCTTLAQVVEFYDSFSSVAPLNLTDQEEADLVAFLAEL